MRGRTDPIARTVHRIAERNAEFVSHGLDTPSKMRYEPAAMLASQKGTFTPMPPGWYLMFCEHYVPLTEGCGACKRKPKRKR